MDLHSSIDGLIVNLLGVARNEACLAPEREAELIQEFRWRFLVLLTATRMDYDAFADAFTDKEM
jgi:hypothetical protein